MKNDMDIDENKRISRWKDEKGSKNKDKENVGADKI